MPLPRDLLQRLQRLRELFLDDTRREGPLPDYWRDADDLDAYDRVLGARIGWKWDAALAECRDRGLVAAGDAVVLDYGCGSGIAARRFAAWFGAREVRCFDRSATARAFAASRLRDEQPAVRAIPIATVEHEAPGVLLVSHVLTELDASGLAALRALIARSQTVLLVEPGSRAGSRALSALRDELLGAFHVLAPCPHAGRCPALANDRDWCHFFAAPPPHVFTDGDWAAAGRQLGIDLRALPYAFLALARQPAAKGPSHRVLGRAEVGRHAATVLACTPRGLEQRTVQKRDEPATWRRLRKDPAALRALPDPGAASG